MRYNSVLITGGAGFIGSHLVDRFLADGSAVRVVDNFQTGSRANLAAAGETGRLTVTEADVISPFAGKADLVVHLACAASPPRYQSDPIHTMQTCVTGTLNAAMLARSNDARLVFTSTSEVYGDPKVHPQREDYTGSVSTTGPRACYDEGKRAAEALLFDFERVHDLDLRLCRIFNTYGPRMDPYDGRVVSNFLRQALMGEPLTIHGDGAQTRSFCYVDDMIEGIWQLSHTPKARGRSLGPVNLGNPEELTVAELAETVRDLIGSRVRLVTRDMPEDDPKRRQPDIGKAKETLGGQPRIALKDGLARTLAYFERVLADGQEPKALSSIA